MRFIDCPYALIIGGVYKCMCAALPFRGQLFILHNGPYACFCLCDIDMRDFTGLGFIFLFHLLY